jgi:hypothetical protein
MKMTHILHKRTLAQHPFPTVFTPPIRFKLNPRVQIPFVLVHSSAVPKLWQPQRTVFGVPTTCAADGALRAHQSSFEIGSESMRRNGRRFTADGRLVVDETAEV